ncbi:MAG: hypothetical protein HY550_03045 [Elusimicrobia bacterium]|nr:hypothetical protein [Elusimicrobiota bacterium]
MAKKPLKVPAEKYQNLGGKSKVAYYKIVKDSVTVRFADHSVYIYSNQSAGRLNVNQMKALAIAGKGLGTFIDANLKEGFARKIR